MTVLPASSASLRSSCRVLLSAPQPNFSASGDAAPSLRYPCRSFSSSARSASLRSAFSACTGRKTSSSISMASCSNANGVFPVFLIQTSTLSRESGCFCACNTCSPSHVISHSSHCSFSVADKSFFNLKNPLIFSLISCSGRTLI